MTPIKYFIIAKINYLPAIKLIKGVMNIKLMIHLISDIKPYIYDINIIFFI